MNTEGSFKCCESGSSAKECGGMAIMGSDKNTVPGVDGKTGPGSFGTPETDGDGTGPNHKNFNHSEISHESGSNGELKTVNIGTWHNKTSRHLIIGRGRIPSQKFWGLELTGRGFGNIFPDSNEMTMIGKNNSLSPTRLLHSLTFPL